MGKVFWNGGALLGPVPPVLVTCGTMEHPNAITIGWTGITATHPPMTYISVRPSGYKVSGGLHGVGSSVVNALSEWLEVEVRDGKNIYHQRFERGNIKSDLEVVGPTSKKGTTIVFKADPEIFCSSVRSRCSGDDSLCRFSEKNTGFLSGANLQISDLRTQFYYTGLFPAN